MVPNSDDGCLWLKANCFLLVHVSVCGLWAPLQQSLPWRLNCAVLLLVARDTLHHNVCVLGCVTSTCFESCLQEARVRGARSFLKEGLFIAPSQTDLSKMGLFTLILFYPSESIGFFPSQSKTDVRQVMCPCPPFATPNCVAHDFVDVKSKVMGFLWGAWWAPRTDQSSLIPPSVSCARSFKTLPRLVHAGAVQQYWPLEVRVCGASRHTYLAHEAACEASSDLFGVSPFFPRETFHCGSARLET